MTSRWRKKASSILAIFAIILLLLLIIFLWTAAKNGVFSTHHQHRTTVLPNSRLSASDVSDEPNLRLATAKLLNNDTSLPLSNFTETTVDEDEPASPMPATLLAVPTPPPPLPAVIEETTAATDDDHKHKDDEQEYVMPERVYEMVKPSKIHVKSLHLEDQLYESKKDTPGADILGNVPYHRITGQFRSKSSRIWDPHPEYLIDAFGYHLHLVLQQDSTFIHKDMKITQLIHISENETMRKHEDNRHFEQLQGCFYKGRVRGDDRSTVTVSLCEGMRGHIYTTDGSFFIEPAENYTMANQAILHRIERENVLQDLPSLDDLTLESDCGTCHGKDCNTSNDPDDNDNDDIVLPPSHDQPPNQHVRRKRNSPSYTNNAYTMKVLVAIDAKMEEYHNQRQHDWKQYVLTLMSIVSSVYSDASIGNSIHIAVVEMMNIGTVVPFDHNGKTLGVSASLMLSTFCKNIQRVSRNHHDTALLLTREPICRNSKQEKCDTLGLAQLGTMCRPSSCSIVQDNGLSAAFTIAHELGHVLSMPHDEDIQCKPYKKNGPPNIMTRMMEYDTQPWSWSECSRHFATEFLENNHGSCMLNKPDQDYMLNLHNEERLAGEIFAANEQCQMIFGSGFSVCTYMPSCKRLWCANDTEACRSQYMPWADGTTCELKGSPYEAWCQRGECVHRDTHALAKVDGGWGRWSGNSTCSRACGGGVRYRMRDCNNPLPVNGGKYCVGQRIQYYSCNTHDCQPPEYDFREEQCARFNKQPLGIDGHGDTANLTWVPKYGASPADECKLYCRPHEATNYFQLGDKVIDGTSCTHGSFNKCVNGVCRPAGCDNILYSMAVLDKCGKCNGNNDTCEDIRESLTYMQLIEIKKVRPTPFYYDACIIPKGALNIEIVQRGSLGDLNYIALIDDNSSYILNGNNVITQYPRTFAYGGITFGYSGTNATMEMVNSSYARKLTRDLRVQILSRTDYYPYHEIMSCSYSIGKDLIQAPTYDYRWRTTGWSKCSKPCSGTRYRMVECVRSDDQLVADDNCAQSSVKPRGDSEECNTNCYIHWMMPECSSDCSRRTEPSCINKTATGVIKQLDSIYCADAPKPSKCETPCWHYAEWQNCSQSCGGGTQSRYAACMVDNVQRAEMYCDPEVVAKEEVERHCNTNACPRTYSYVEDTPNRVAKSSSDAAYAAAVRNRVVVCEHNKRHVVNSDLCENQQQMAHGEPVVIEYTDEPPPKTQPHRHHHMSNNVYDDPTTTTTKNVRHRNHYKWRTSRWGDCSVPCGDGGHRMRSVRCANADENMELIDDRYCSDVTRPTNVTTCEQQQCAEWEIGEYGECSTTCGTGKRNRQRLCMRLPLKSERNPNPRKKGQTVAASFCAHMKQPSFRPKSKVCIKPCHTYKWESTAWSRCSVECGQGFSNRNVTCMFANNVVDDRRCSHMPKPIKSRRCENTDGCSWVPGPWRNCNCFGHTKRRVNCYDRKLNKLSNSCPEHKKPIQKRACHPPPNCSCKSIRQRLHSNEDREYELNIRGQQIRIFCHHMDTEDPKEYITLMADTDENYALFYDKRSRDKNRCPRSERDVYKDPSILAGLTYFEKVRLNLQTLTVVVDDYSFVRSTGHLQPFGSAADCYTTKPSKCLQGHFSINFTGTKFQIRPGTRWDTRNSTMVFIHKLESPYKKVSARCGGYCGSCSVSRTTALQLQVEVL